MQACAFVIIGAGMAGLSCAFHLGDADVIVLEGEERVGGICRTHVRNEFVFDHVAHFLHLRDSRARALIDRLLPDAFETHQRSAAIYLAGRYVPYPFQAHLGALPPELLRDCLLGFIEARAQHGTNPTASASDLLDWFHRTFGDGMTRHFFEPHNRKTYCCGVAELTSEWATQYVPQPSVDQVVDGVAFGTRQTNLGYNSRFLYPRDGGIEVLPRALAAHIRTIRCHDPVISVDARQRLVTCASGASYKYQTLISTIPLDGLVAMAKGLPARIRRAARRLRAADVVDLQLGFDRPPSVPFHWVYFPEPHFPFVRVVLPSNASPGLAPAGMCTLHIEANFAPNTSVDMDALLSISVRQLQEIGFLPADARICSQEVLRIRAAYVLHDHHREQALPEIRAGLQEHGIHSIGRYGGWGYGSIESALVEGMEQAALLLQKSTLVERSPARPEAVASPELTLSRQATD